MTKKVVPLLIGMALTSIPAAALPSAANLLLQGSIQSLREAGYPGLDEVKTLPALAAAPSSNSPTPADETQEALAQLIRTAESRPETTGINETAQALGFEFKGNFLDKELEKQSTVDAFRHFSIAKFHGETVIVLEVYSRAAKELRSYMASSAGILTAAAVTTKPNGVFHAVAIPLPNPEAAADFAAQTGFWTQYYRDHLKH